MKERTSKLNWKAVAMGCGIGVLTMVLLCALGAWLMTGAVVGMDTMNLWAAGIAAAMGLTGSLVSHLSGGEKAEAVLTALAEFVVLIGLNLLLNEGEMEGILPGALAIAGGSGAGVLLTLGKGRAHRRRRRR